MTPFDCYLIAAMFVLLVVNTIVQFKLGFSNGSRGGYTVGMYHAVSWLMKTHALECENKTTGRPASAADVVIFIMQSNTYNQFKLTDNKEDLKKIAEATVELDKE